MNEGVITGLLNQVDEISTKFVLSGFQQLVDYCSPFIIGMATLSIIIFGYLITIGEIDLSLREVAKRIILLGCVLSLALNWGTFSTYVYQLFTEAPNELSMVVMKALPHSLATSANSGLEQAWNDGLDIVIAVWDRGGLSNPFPYLVAILMLLGLIYLVWISMRSIIEAKFGLAINMVLAPLAIPMLFFKPTKESLFDGWLRHLIGYALVPVFITASIALSLVLLSSSMTYINSLIGSDNVSMKRSAGYIIYILISIGLVSAAKEMATSMANGFSSATSPAFSKMSDSTKQMVSKVMSTFKGGRQSPATALASAVSSPANPSHLTKSGT